MEPSPSDLKSPQVEANSEQSTWELVIKVMSLASLFKASPSEKGVVPLFKSLVSHLSSKNPSSPDELGVVVDTFIEVILLLKESANDCFSELWTFLSRQVFCVQVCPPFFEKLHLKVVQASLKLVALMFKHFEDHRDSLFESFTILLKQNENMSLFVTRSAKTFSKSVSHNQHVLQNSQKTLENVIMGEFWKIVNNESSSEMKAKTRIVAGANLSESLKVSCGLVNLGATCYFNSLVQQFANMKWFVKLVLGHCSEKGNLPRVSQIGNGESKG